MFVAKWTWMGLVAKRLRGLPQWSPSVGSRFGGEGVLAPPPMEKPSQTTWRTSYHQLSGLSTKGLSSRAGDETNRKCEVWEDVVGHNYARCVHVMRVPCALSLSCRPPCVRISPPISSLSSFVQSCMAFYLLSCTLTCGRDMKGWVGIQLALSRSRAAGKFIWKPAKSLKWFLLVVVVYTFFFPLFWCRL